MTHRLQDHPPKWTALACTHILPSAQSWPSGCYTTRPEEAEVPTPPSAQETGTDQGARSSAVEILRT